MAIQFHHKFRNVYFRLLVFIVICTITIRVLRTSSFEHPFTSNRTSLMITQQEQDGCRISNSGITIRQLFRDYFSLLNDSIWLAKSATYSLSFQELHSLLFGGAAPNLYTAWPNHFKKTPDLAYPHTFLTEQLLMEILKATNISVTFVVEVGSFMGRSAINIGRTLLNNQPRSKFILLCIDTWVGGLEHWTVDEERKLMGIEYGRPIVYEQFMANIIGHNLTDYVIPYSTTSVMGARFLLDRKLFPQIVYLDSGHLQGETYLELELYWLLLQVGGILIGDDWSWTSVRCDVLQFTNDNKVNVTVIENTWWIKKQK